MNDNHVLTGTYLLKLDNHDADLYHPPCNSPLSEGWSCAWVIEKTLYMNNWSGTLVNILVGPIIFLWRNFENALIPCLHSQRLQSMKHGILKSWEDKLESAFIEKKKNDNDCMELFISHTCAFGEQVEHEISFEALFWNTKQILRDNILLL